MGTGRALTKKQATILLAIKKEMSSGKPLEAAMREVIKSRMFNHMTVRRCAEKLARNPDSLDQLWVNSEGKGINKRSWKE